MSDPLEKQLFDFGNAYYCAANIIMIPPSSAKVDSHLFIQPAVTCAALSLKLFIKCMRAIEGRDTDDIYRFTELFQSLSEGTQNSFLQKYDEFSNTALSTGGLIKHLEALDSAFVNWRYLREEDAKSVNLEDLEEMILAAKAAITSVKTEWV